MGVNSLWLGGLINQQLHYFFHNLQKESQINLKWLTLEQSSITTMKVGLSYFALTVKDKKDLKT